MTEARVSQEFVEILTDSATPSSRVSQAIAEVLTNSATPSSTISQGFAEVLSYGTTTASNVSQEFAEILVRLNIKEIVAIPYAYIPIMFRKWDRTGWLYQPNFIRNRHRYRGPRESFKINQEITQAHYDIRRIDMMVDDIRDSLSDRIDGFFDGESVTGVTVDWGDDATPVEYDVTITSYDSMVGRIQSLKERIKDLEE